MPAPVRASDIPADPVVDVLRQARVEQDLSQRDLGASLGYHFKTISSYETSLVLPRLDVLREWADALGYTVTVVPAVAHCAICGCTDEQACEGGCQWVSSDTGVDALCSSCAWSITRESIASGLYPLEPTIAETLLEARGVLLEQPPLSDEEIEALQPLIDAVEAVAGGRHEDAPSRSPT